jgi:hypothetical protein
MDTEVAEITEVTEVEDCRDAAFDIDGGSGEHGLATQQRRGGRRVRYWIAMIVSAAVLAMGATGAAAEKPKEDVNRWGPYAALSASGVGLLGIDDFTAPGVAVDASDPNGGLDLRGGYRFGRWVSAEAEFEWIRMKVNVTDLSGAIPPIEVSGDAYTFTVGAKAHLVRWVNAEIVASVGVGLLNDSGVDTAFAARFGAGLDVYVTENAGVSLMGTYVLPTGSLEQLDYVGVQIGLIYRF